MWKSNSLMLFGILGLSCATTAQGNGCSASQPSISAPRGNSWKAISVDESAEITSWLQTRLSLTGDSGSSQDSFVKQISALHSNKTDVIQYLDGYADAPARFARATVVIGATNSTDLYWQEYMVGPLPVTNSTVATPLTYPFTNQEPGKTKVHPIYSVNDGASFTLQLNTNIEDITKALWNSTLVEGAIGLRFGVPYTNDEGRIISWAGFFANPIGLVSSPTILPLGVSIQFDLTGRNWEDWKTIGWYSRGEYYNSTEAFRETISAPDFVKPPPNENGNWTSTDKQGDPLPLDDLPPPISVAQGSQRFKIDTVEDYVSWMDFSFYFAVSHDLGLSLHDVKFKGTRLMYELSLQEAITTYAGSDPYAAQSTYLDTGTGFGTVLQPLLKGYDCPYHATYLNATFAEGNSTRTQAGAICIFEHDASYPIRRHSFSPSAPFTSVAKNIVFTMRTISTIGNYDFLIEYNFFYDGSIQVSARASGYISAAYWEGKSEYGFHIHDHLSGSLHDHVLTFKADLDILGTKNSMQKVDFVPTSTTYPWSQGRVYNTFKVSKSIESNEISVKWPFNDGTIYAIVNKDKPNRFGEYPGFRIKRSAGTSHLTTLNSTAAGNAAAYATHDFYVTQQKDTEPRATDPFNQFAVEDPLVDFANFLDGESIEQEDLVVWFNLGMHHIPHTGDLPNTIYEAAHSAMRFEPLNYLEGDPSVASNQQVRLDLGEDGSITSVEEFGKKPGLCDAQKLG